MKKLLLLAVVCIIVGGIGASLTWKSYAETVNKIKERETQKIEANEQIKNIQVDLEAGDVKIEKGHDSSFYIEKSAMLEKQEVIVEEKGDTLIVEADIEKGISFDFSFLSVRAPQITVIVPEREYNDIKAHTKAGDVTVLNLDSERVDVSTSAGDINVQNVATSVVEGISKAGDIQTNNVTGDVIAKTMSGDVDMIDHAPNYSVVANSKAGDIYIRLLETPKDAKVIGNSTAGDVEIFQQEDKFVEFGNGEVTIKGETLAGDVKVEVR